MFSALLSSLPFLSSDLLAVGFPLWLMALCDAGWLDSFWASLPVLRARLQLGDWIFTVPVCDGVPLAA